MCRKTHRFMFSVHFYVFCWSTYRVCSIALNLLQKQKSPPKNCSWPSSASQNFFSSSSPSSPSSSSPSSPFRTKREHLVTGPVCIFKYECHLRTRLAQPLRDPAWQPGPFVLPAPPPSFGSTTPPSTTVSAEAFLQGDDPLLCAQPEDHRAQETSYVVR